MSVEDILAAARGQGAGASKPAAVPKSPVAKAPSAKAPAAGKPAAATAAKPASGKAAAKPAGPMDTSSILAAARQGTRPGPISKSQVAAKTPVAKTAPTKPPVPVMPTKPVYALPKSQPAAPTDRRGFFSLLFGSFLAVGFSSLGITGALWSLGMARFMFPNILIEPPSRFKVGFPSDFAPDSVADKFKAQFGVWIVNTEYHGQLSIFALKTVCTHLGCTPNWLEAEQKFKCPCHGSGFYKDGINFEGPAPRPLERYAIRVADDGQLEIDKSKTFQQEMGQWNDAASFVPV
jgi:cytochrome b6-f complex iron-sulfur subunit